MAHSLGLDEALVSLNKSASLAEETVQVWHQLDECFGCPLERLAGSGPKLEDFVVGTKHTFQLELRANRRACQLKDVALNNHGLYRIHVSQSGNASQQLDCALELLQTGDCNLCPVAVLVCALFLLTLGERLYSRFLRRPASAGKSAESIGISEPAGTSDQEIRRLSTVSKLNNEDDSDGSQQLARPAARSAPRRVEALDAFRGLTIAGMIFVNYGGAGYPMLQHAAWDGLTLADFVFPFFIFSMGASVAISTKCQLARGKSFGDLIVKILRRSALLMALGLCLNSKWLQGRGLHHLRLTGVLQRFSLSYLVVAPMYSVELILNRWLRQQSLSRVRSLPAILCGLVEALTGFNYLCVYLYVSLYLDYDRLCPPGYLGPGGQTEGGRYENCTGGSAAWLDRLVLGESHLYQDHEVKQIFKTRVNHDPEGLLGYTTSILLTLIGLQCGKILIRQRAHKTVLVKLAQWLLLLALSCVSVIAIPINKRLWSLTFVTLTGASAYLVIILLYLLLDVYQCERTLLLRLLLSAGKNAIFLYCGHSLLSDMLPWHFVVDETSHLQLLVRLTWSTLVWLLVAHYMALKGLFIKL